MSNVIVYALNLESIPALKRAQVIASKLGSELYLCYVTDFEEEKEEDDLYFGQRVGDWYVNREEHVLTSSIESMLSQTNISKEDVYIINGEVGEAIDRFASSVKAELVIISKTHHKFGLFMNHQKAIERKSHHDLYILGDT